MSEIEMTEVVGTPATPGSNKWKIYPKGDGWYAMDDTGTEIGPLDVGGGGDITEYQIAVSISTNDLVVALKDKNGSDPSSGTPVSQKIGGSVYDVTSALSLTVAAGTDVFNLGDAMFAAKKQQLFVYLGYNNSGAAVFLGVSRMPWAKVYGDFSGTSTDEDYIAISSGTPAATDPVEVIGRIDVQNSGTASYNWSIPSGAVVVHKPIFETDILTFLPTFTNLTVGDGTLTAQFKIDYDKLIMNIHLVWGSTTSVSGAVNFAVPIISQQFDRSGGAGNDYSAIGTVSLIDTATALYMGAAVLRETQDNIELRAINAAGTYAVWANATASVPHTWANTDTMDINGEYSIN